LISEELENSRIYSFLLYEKKNRVKLCPCTVFTVLNMFATTQRLVNNDFGVIFG